MDSWDGDIWLQAGYLSAEWITGMLITVISFIVHINVHPKAAAIVAGIGYAFKLPVYVMAVSALFSPVYHGKEWLLRLLWAVIIIAATGYLVHMIKFAVQNKRSPAENETDLTEKTGL